MAMVIATAMAMRLADDKAGKVKVCKGDDNGDEGGGCRKPLINVPYKRTFGAPDQGQMLDV